jgi:gluconate 2-dehydrogenase gamma chain
MEEQIIARRTALRYLGLLTGSAAGREFLAGWLPSAKAASTSTMPGMSHTAPPQESATPYAPQFFKPEEFRTVELLTEMIIPTDDKPGAKEAQVANYIDFVVFAAAENKPEMQKEWVSGLAMLDQLSQEKYHRPFRDASATDREGLLMEMSLPEHDPKASHPGFAFYRLVKVITVEGFYTSRVGLIDVLEFQGRTAISEFPGCTHPEHQT